MRKVTVLTILILTITSLSYADSCVGRKGRILNSCVDHPVKEARSSIGAGADIFIYEDNNVDVSEEYRYDWQNGSHSLYTVVKTKKSVVEYVKEFLGR